MRTARWTSALLAGVCTLSVALPMLTLFTPGSWVPEAVLVIGAVALAGGFARRWSGSHGVVLGSQWVALAAVLHALFLLERAWYALPTWASLGHAGQLLAEALDAVRTSAAPVPLEPGISFAIVLLVGVTAVVVDYLAVTRRAPAVAGLPLLAAYLISASNSSGGLPLRYFLIAGGAFLALLGEDGLSALRRWAGLDEPSLLFRGADSTSEFGRTGRVMGVVALALAVAVPAMLPQRGPTFLAEGLGRAVSGGHGVSLNSTLDLNRSLSDQSLDPVLRYTTTAMALEPLRVEVLDRYADGEWTAIPTPIVDTGGVMPTPEGVPAGTPRAMTRILENRIQAPQLAMPSRPVALSLSPEEWHIDRHGTYWANRQVERYDVTTLQFAPKVEDFPTKLAVPPDPRALEVDETVRGRVARLDDEIVPDGATPLETAWAIQGYLRGEDFKYSLELAPPVRDPSGAPADDALSQFLLTRRGYCIQFATAMIMMSRARGIPARMVIGYLPGSFKNGAYTIVAADAHAWPELWFSGLGWVRFEPTPAVRSGGAPGWSAAPVALPTPGVPSQRGATARPVTPQRPDVAEGPVAGQETTTAADRVIAWLGAHWVPFALGLVLLAGVAALPAGSWLSARRARRGARLDADRVEAQWQRLIDDLSDLGVPPDVGATPRQAGERVSSRAALGPADADAMARVVTTLERARYAAPDNSPLDMSADVRLVRHAVARSRGLRARAAARLWPRSGARYWQERAEALRGRGRPQSR